RCCKQRDFHWGGPGGAWSATPGLRFWPGRPPSPTTLRNDVRTATRLSCPGIVEVVVGLGDALAEPPDRLLGGPPLERVEHVLGGDLRREQQPTPVHHEVPSRSAQRPHRHAVVGRGP